MKPEKNRKKGGGFWKDQPERRARCGSNPKRTGTKSMFGETTKQKGVLGVGNTPEETEESGGGSLGWVKPQENWKKGGFWGKEQLTRRILWVGRSKRNRKKAWE